MAFDPIIQEVYAAKDKLARKYGGDAAKLFAHLREAAKAHPERMARPPKPRKSSARKRASTRSSK